MKRKKRLEKGIESIQEQIEFHKEKLQIARQEGKEELADYYEREILQKESEKQKKEDQRSKQ